MCARCLWRFPTSLDTVVIYIDSEWFWYRRLWQLWCLRLQAERSNSKRCDIDGSFSSAFSEKWPAWRLNHILQSHRPLLKKHSILRWTDLTSTQWHTGFTDLTSMEQISPHPNGTPQETESDLANDAIPISTMPLRFAIPEYKKYLASDAYPGAVPNGTLAKPIFEVLIWILSGRLRFVKGKSFGVGIRPKDVFIENITNPIP